MAFETPQISKGIPTEVPSAFQGFLMNFADQYNKTKMLQTEALWKQKVQQKEPKMVGWGDIATIRENYGMPKFTIDPITKQPILEDVDTSILPAKQERANTMAQAGITKTGMTTTEKARELNLKERTDTEKEVAATVAKDFSTTFSEPEDRAAIEAYNVALRLQKPDTAMAIKGITSAKNIDELDNRYKTMVQTRYDADGRPLPPLVDIALVTKAYMAAKSALPKILKRKQYEGKTVGGKVMTQIKSLFGTDEVPPEIEFKEFKPE